MLDDDYQFHKDLVDFQQNEIMSKHYSLNAARLRLFRINIGQPLLRLTRLPRSIWKFSRPARRATRTTAVDLLTKHIEISREHALGIRPMRQFADRLVAVGSES